jgi:hypothetical protein
LRIALDAVAMPVMQAQDVHRVWLPLFGGALEQIDCRALEAFLAVPFFKQDGEVADRDNVATPGCVLITLPRATQGAASLLQIQVRIRTALVVGASQIEQESRRELVRFPGLEAGRNRIFSRDSLECDSWHFGWAIAIEV